ncbi:MAG: hypothetical protein HZA24_05945 [Nitrospirae bacterium]|nr:hypothetical protein [Nitrospirota bacterium]
MTNREIIWQSIRRLGCFTLHDVPATVSTKTVQSYVEGLLRTGYVVQLMDGKVPGRWQLAQYQLIHDVGIEPPHVTRYGQTPTHGLQQEQMWRTMPILGAFTARELALAASTERIPVSVHSARHYICHLRKAGYVLRISPSLGTAPARYRMPALRHTGPRPPRIGRGGTMHDPNLRGNERPEPPGPRTRDKP